MRPAQDTDITSYSISIYEKANTKDDYQTVVWTALPSMFNIGYHTGGNTWACFY